MFKLQEKSQVIQCREADLQVLRAAIPKAEAKYLSVYGVAAPQLTVDQIHFLAKAAQTQEEEDDPDAATWYELCSVLPQCISDWIVGHCSCPCCEALFMLQESCPYNQWYACTGRTSCTLP
jgi:hypothetical protein